MQPARTARLFTPGPNGLLRVVGLFAVTLTLWSALASLAHPQSANASGLNAWATSSAAGNDDSWEQVTYGNGRFVAITNAGLSEDTVMYSTDGITWATTSAAGDDDTWLDITYGNGRFVAVSGGGDRVTYSTDGITWATTSAAGNNDAWYGVTYANGRFVAVGGTGDRVMTSVDGITWATTSAAGNNDSWNDVTYGNGRFVAVGQSGDRVMHSTDGITWATTSAAGDNDIWQAITYGNGRFVAVGDSGDRVMQSTDGITWATTSAAGNNDSWTSITYGNGRFVAVGAYSSSDRVMYSTDGLTWATTSAAGDDDTWLDITYGNGRFVAVGSAGDRVMYATATHPLTQSGFRFRDDNGSETTASYLGAQNSNTTAPLNDTLRLRTQIEATDEAVANRYYVQYKKTTDPTWNTVGRDGDFPTIVATSTGRSTGDATSHSVTLPTCAAGNLLLTIFSYDATGPASTVSSGWNKMGEGTNGIIVSGAVFWKIADGNDTLSVALAVTQEASYITYCIANAGTPVGRVTDGSGTNSNPVSLSTGANRSTLWIATRSGDAQVGATAAPSGFFNRVQISASTTNGATTDAAHTYLFSSTTDPGTFTSATEQWVSWTIAVPPKDTPIARNLAMSSGASTTGANNTGYGSIAWTNPTQASSSNNLRASVTLSSTTATNNLYLTNWGFNIPENATILGIEAYFEKLQSGGTAGNARDNSVRLIKNGTTTGSNNLGLTATNWQTTEWVVPYGSSTALWGLTWTPADINATNFGVAIAVQGAAAGANRVANIDHAQMNVYYTVPSDIILASSTNIATGGASTTAQLISPGAMATSSFQGGHITDDQTPTPLVITDAGRYSELEWNLVATGTATTGNAYQLRTVSEGAEELGDYRSNALWTIGTYQTPGTFALSGNIYNEYGTTTSPGAGVPIVAAVTQDGNPVLYSTTTSTGGAYSLTIATGTTPGASWRTISAAGDNDAWKAIIYGNGRFVAVGGINGSPDANVMYSDDGLSWTPIVASNGNDNWVALAYGSGTFVALTKFGGGPLMTSPDGITWTDQSSTAASGGNWNSVTYGNGRFVAVGSTAVNNVMYSEDGITWATTSAAGNNDQWSAVTYGNGRFVAVGNFTTGDGIMYSEDGITWATTTVAGEDDIWNSITYGNGRFVAGAAFSGPVMYSLDGISWVLVSGAPDYDWNSMAYGNGRFVALNTNDGPSMYSTDGITWATTTVAGNNDEWMDVAYGNGRFVAVGCGGSSGCGSAGDRIVVSDAGLGLDTAYTIYSNSSSSPATTFFAGASGASAQSGVNLYKNTVMVQNATTNAASSTTDFTDAVIYDASDDVDVLFTKQPTSGNLQVLGNLLVATGTTEYTGPGLYVADQEKNYDVTVQGTLDISGAGIVSSGNLNITASGTLSAPQNLEVYGNYSNSGSFINNNGTVLFGGRAAYNTKVGYFQMATSTPDNATGVAFSDDGTRMYLSNYSGGIKEYILDTSFDVSSGSLNYELYAASNINVSKVSFANGGRKLYFKGWQNDIVDEFTLATPWELATAVFTASSSFGGDSFPSQMHISEDGRSLYLSGPATDQIRYYTLSTPYNIQSAVLQGSLVLSYQQGYLPFVLSSDGRYLIRQGYSQFFTRYRLATPWDISTAVEEEESRGPFNELFREEGGDIQTIWVDKSGTRFAVGHSGPYISTFYFGAELSGNMTGSSSFNSTKFETGKVIFNAAASTTAFENVSAYVVAPTTTLTVAQDYINGQIVEHSSLGGTLVLSGGGSVSGPLTGTSSLNNVIIEGNYSFPSGTTTVRSLTIKPSASLTFRTDLGSSTLEVFGDYQNSGTSTLASTTLVTRGDGFDLYQASREKEFDVTAQAASPKGLAFSATGTYMYIADNSAEQVFAYRLGVPWEISTASYLYATSVLAYTTDPDPVSLQFKPDGTRMYIFDWNNLEAEFSLAVPWDIRTATFVATTSVIGCCGGLEFAFSADGTKYYETDAADGGAIQQYTLATPWTLSTATLNDSFLGRGSSYLEMFAVSSDGRTLIKIVNGDQIRQFRMLTPHDLNTVQEVGDFSLADISDGEEQMTFNASGTKLYIVENFDDIVYQYDLVDTQTIAGTLTGTSSPANISTSGTLPIIMASAASTSNFTIAASSTVLAPTSTLTISGNFENRGTFIPRAGTTTLSGAGKTITGALTSWDTTTQSPDFGHTNITGSYTVVGNATTSALSINSGASLTAPSGGTLTIDHDFENNGTFVNNGATTTLSGNLRTAATGSNALGNTVVNARSQAMEWQVLATSSAAGNNDAWNAITYGNGRFVAVGGNTDGSPDDFAMYSSDGLTWATTTATDNNWVTLAYGNGIFVALSVFGGGPMMTSPDGITWTDRSPTAASASYWNSITYGNGRFVAVGALSGNARVMYSNDGLTWATTSAAGNDDDWNSVTYGNGRFVAVGNDTSGDGAMYSYDGITWATTTLPGDANIYVSVEYGNGKFVAGAAYDTDGPMMYSFDGISWVKLPNVYDRDWYVMTYGNGYFTALSNVGDLMYSADGLTWATTSAAGNNDDWNSVAYGNGRFVAVGCGGNGGICGAAGDRIITAQPISNLFGNASTSNLIINSSSILNASGTTVSVTNNYTNNGTLTASSSTFVFNGTNAQVATGTMSSSSKFFNLRLENTSGNGTTSRSVTFGAPVTASGTMTMIASTSAAFAAGATSTFQNVSWQGSAGSPVWLRSTATGTPWILTIPGSQLSVDYVNVRDSNATSTVGGVTPTNSTDAGNNTNWNFGAGPTAPVWNATDWTLYDTITIQEENIDADLTDFPVYVNLDDLSSTFWATTPGAAALVGTDIRVTTVSNVEVPRELVFASSTLQTGELHFKAPSISSTTDTVFKIWYNGTTTGDYVTSSTYGAQNVWTNEYLGVYHLDNNPALGAGAIKDSTSFARHGTSSGSVTSADEVSGKLGNSLDFDGDDYVLINGLFGQPARGTLSTWVEVDTIPSVSGELISLGDSFAIRAGNGIDTKGFYHQTGTWNDTPAGQQPTVPYSWKYLAYTNNPSASSQVIYTNGEPDGSSSFSAPILYDQGTSTFFGRHGNNQGNMNLDGRLDEARIASTTRSAAWIKAEYYNQSTSTDFYGVNLAPVTGSTTILAHTAGQVPNVFDFRAKTDASLFAFRLQPNSGTATVTNAVFTLAGAQKVSASNFSNLRLLRDTDGDAQYDAADVAVGGTGSMTLNGQSGTITFTGDFLSTTTQNYIVVGDFTAPANGSFLWINFPGTGLTMIDATGTQAIFGSITGVQHNRNNKGGGSGNIGGDAPAGQGNQTGGGGQGGQLIGDDPSFRWPTANNSPAQPWGSPESAYDRTDGTYSTVTGSLSQDYTNHTFGVATGTVITGIEVKLEVSGSTGQGTIDVALSWNGGSNFTTVKSTPTVTTSDVVVSLGGQTDLWGRSWTTSEFSNANFELRLTAQPVSNTIRVDAVQVRVYHQAGGGGGGGGGEI